MIGSQEFWRNWLWHLHSSGVGRFWVFLKFGLSFFRIWLEFWVFLSLSFFSKCPKISPGYWLFWLLLPIKSMNTPFFLAKISMAGFLLRSIRVCDERWFVKPIKHIWDVVFFFRPWPVMERRSRHDGGTGRCSLGSWGWPSLCSRWSLGKTLRLHWLSGDVRSQRWSLEARTQYAYL